jgi:hypothetical protein
VEFFGSHKPLIKSRKALRVLSGEEAAAARRRLSSRGARFPALGGGNWSLPIGSFTGLSATWRGLDPIRLKLYQPLLWPDMVFYFSVSAATYGRRVSATRMPNFYEAGQDVTKVDDPVESYVQFIGRVIREYESLALIFNFITVDAEQSINDQHRRLRELFRERQRLLGRSGTSTPSRNGCR